MHATEASYCKEALVEVLAVLQKFESLNSLAAHDSQRRQKGVETVAQAGSNEMAHNSPFRDVAVVQYFGFVQGGFFQRIRRLWAFASDRTCHNSGPKS